MCYALDIEAQGEGWTLGDGASEAALHQLIGPGRGLKGARVAPQAGKFSFKEARDVGHRVHPLMRGHSPRSR